MKIATRVILGFAAMCVIAGAGHLYQAWLVDRLQEVDRRQTQLGIRAGLAALRVHALAADLEEFAYKYNLTGDEVYRSGLVELRRNVEDELERLRSAAELQTGSPLEPSAVQLQQAVRSTLEAWTEIGRLLDRQPAGNRNQPTDGDIRQAFQSFFSTLEVGIEASNRFLEESAERSQRTREEVTLTSRAVLAGSVVLAVVVSLLVYRSISHSLAEFAAATRRIAGGDFRVRVDQSRGGELATLGAMINHMARRLGELDQLKKDFVSSVSHDLRAPLASIQETTQLLLDELSGDLDPTRRQLLELNLEAGRRLSRMIGELLDLSRLEAGAIAFEFEVMDSRALACETADSLRALFRERGVELRLAVEAASPPAIRVDRMRFIQALTNLLANAAEFSPRGGRVDLQIGRMERLSLDPPPPGSRNLGPPPYCRFSVVDTGPGVPPEDRERIFERFFSADPKAVRNRKGTGLGLAIARHIVEAHQGVIWVESGPDGRGSRFNILVPAEAPVW
jgi:signal transduction histidine kinase